MYRISQQEDLSRGVPSCNQQPRSWIFGHCQLRSAKTKPVREHKIGGIKNDDSYHTSDSDIEDSGGGSITGKENAVSISTPVMIEQIDIEDFNREFVAHFGLGRHLKKKIRQFPQPSSKESSWSLRSSSTG